MAATITDLDGLYKKVYSNRLENAVPDIAISTIEMPFQTAKKIGKDYNQPIVLTNTQGVTFAAPEDGAYSLNAPVAMNIRNAVVQGYQMTMREFIPYDTAEQAVSGGPAAFASSIGTIMQNMKDSATKYTETVLLYGGKNIGQTSASSNVSATSTTITIDTATWAVGIWTASENTRIDIYQNDDSTLINSNAALSISGVDTVNRQITLTGNSADITALDAYLAANDNSTIYFYGAKGKEMLGLDYSLVTSGTVNGIDNTAYSLWKGNTFSAGSAKLTVNKFLQAIAVPFGVGGLSTESILYVEHDTWSDLAAEFAGNRRLDSSYKEDTMANGQRVIKYYSQNGLTSVIANPFVKRGEAFLFPKPKRGYSGSIRRIGATEWTYNVANKGQIFFNRQDENAFEVRMYTNQNFLNACPAKCVKITNIVPGA